MSKLSKMISRATKFGASIPVAILDGGIEGAIGAFKESTVTGPAIVGTSKWVGATVKDFLSEEETPVAAAPAASAAPTAPAPKAPKSPTAKP